MVLRLAVMERVLQKIGQRWRTRVFLALQLPKEQWEARTIDLNVVQWYA